MRATKEEARRVQQAVIDLAAAMTDEELGFHNSDSVLKSVIEFLQVAGNRLPTQEAVDRDNNRRKVQRAAEKGFNS